MYSWLLVWFLFINDVSTLSRYKNRVLDIRTQIRETSQDVKKIAWWTEYVIRTKGALHLRSTLAWEPWYQRYDMDIIIFLTIVIFIIFLIIISIIVNIFMYFYKMMDTSTHRKHKIHWNQYDLEKKFLCIQVCNKLTYFMIFNIFLTLYVHAFPDLKFKYHVHIIYHIYINYIKQDV